MAVEERDAHHRGQVGHGHGVEDAHVGIEQQGLRRAVGGPSRPRAPVHHAHQQEPGERQEQQHQPVAARLLDRHLQHLMDILTLVGDAEGLAVVTYIF